MISGTRGQKLGFAWVSALALGRMRLIPGLRPGVGCSNRCVAGTARIGGNGVLPALGARRRRWSAPKRDLRFDIYLLIRRGHRARRGGERIEVERAYQVDDDVDGTGIVVDLECVLLPDQGDRRVRDDLTACRIEVRDNRLPEAGDGRPEREVGVRGW